MAIKGAKPLPSGLSGSCYHACTTWPAGARSGRPMHAFLDRTTSRCICVESACRVRGRRWSARRTARATDHACRQQRCVHSADAGLDLSRPPLPADSLRRAARTYVRDCSTPCVPCSRVCAQVQGVNDETDRPAGFIVPRVRTYSAAEDVPSFIVGSRHSIAT
jgi:hypothetical protein